jgi:hydrogenase maturation protease
MNKAAMIIGYGNELRGDDAIGQKIANTVSSWHLSSVQSLAVHQLTPELAEPLAHTDLAIFVDACIDGQGENVQVELISPNGSGVVSCHLGDPRSLLALTEYIYGHCPSAWLVTVPGANFEISDRLSSTAQNGIAIALIKIVHLLDQCQNLWVH